MSSIELLDPNMSAIIPKRHTKIFFQIIQLNFPNPCSQKVTISMRIGMSRPSIEKQNAPIKPMKGPIVGTATANRTAAVTRIVLIV